MACADHVPPTVWTRCAPVIRPLWSTQQWMSRDFEDERKWKRNKQKVLGGSLLAYMETRESKAVKEARVRLCCDCCLADCMTV